MDQKKLRGVYARLLGLRNSTNPTMVLYGSTARDFDSLMKQAELAVDESFADFLIPAKAYYRNSSEGDEYCEYAVYKAKLEQVISYLEHMFHVAQNIIEIGSLYNSIKDPELKDRCADLLSAPRNFDRAINQATQILEDRIRKKSGVDVKFSGTQLVNEVLKTDIAKTIIILSDDKDEHEGLCHVARGIMQAFRNPTHHIIADKFSREDALKVCAFIDNLLRIIDGATVQKA